MRKLIALVLILGVLAGQAALAAEEKDPLDIPIKHLYSAPLEDAGLIYKIPIEVKLLDISEDTNWYKVKISFNIGPFSYTYVGWTHIPVGKILAERKKEPDKIARLPNNCWVIDEQ